MSKTKEEKQYPKPFGMCVVGGYSMDLYCATDADNHGYEEGQDSFGGRNWLACVIQARKAGWKIDFKKDIALCPACVKKEKENRKNESN